MTRRARVLLDEDLCGSMEETEDGVAFRYDEHWLESPDARPVSLTLPLRSDPYVTSGVHPFFLGLLPEGWLLDVALSSLKVSRDDGFGLVSALCRDCQGAVRVLPDEEAEDVG